MNDRDNKLIARALRVMESTASEGETFTSAHAVRAWAQLRCGSADREEFHVAFLNNQNCLIAAECLFMGTINQAQVFPREIVRRALLLNAAAIILVHNHPSGCVDPSNADREITKMICNAAALLDIRVLDHIIATRKGAYSFAECGLL